MCNNMCVGHKVGCALVIIGAINWGLVGLFQFNLVSSVLGSWPMVERVVYVLVGLSGLMMLCMGMCKGCKMCASDKKVQA